MVNKTVVVTVKNDNVAEVIHNINLLSRKRLYVGIPDKTASRPPDPGQVAGLNNATIGFIQNMGSPRRNIPARPFLTLGVFDAKALVIDRMKAISIKSINGEKDALEKGFHALGLAVVSIVRKRMTAGPWFPLSPGTIADRRRRRKNGMAGTKPLIDTGRLRQAITYVIRS
jgi:phage gpG-like protein